MTSRGRYSIGVPSVAWIVTLLLSVAVQPVRGQSTATDPTKTQQRFGQAEVTGDDVYVRSGASLNHYPVCKLKAGTRITVVGETGEWYEIRPPEGVFSYISGDYVDSPDGKRGIVNGNRVRVRAGSLLSDFAKLKYVVQSKLSKGAEVTIIGHEPDGFLRIVPPEGATYWINRNFVEMVPPSLLTLEKQTDFALGTTQAPTSSSKTTLQKDSAKHAEPNGQPGDALARLPASTERDKLRQLDARAAAEIAKPVLERHFDSILAAYRSFASQTGDGFARRYAEARITQLTDMAKIVDTVRKMRRLNEEAASKRRAFLEGRASVSNKLPPIPKELDAQGELRTSAIYPEGSLPRRYRLVDTTGVVERTIGYVEIPVGSTISVKSFLGRYVGVRAKSKRLQSGGVNPVPIFVVGDLILLEQAKTDSSGTEGG